MAYFQVNGSGSQKAVINGNIVTKVVDFGSSRTIYFGTEQNFYQATDTLVTILAVLKGV